MRLKEQIEKQLQFMGSIIEDGSKSQTLNPAISNWAVSQHLDHILKAAERILTQLNTGENKATKAGNLFGKFILFIGKIPKGRKSPKIVEGEKKSPTELADSLARVKSLLDSLDFNTLELSTFDHHVFGGLNGYQWLRFMIIHNRHHERIIQKILTTK